MADGDIQDDVVQEVDAAQAEADLRSDPSIDIEGLAAEMGWAPREKWAKAPEDWRDAPEFLRHTVSANRKLRDDLKSVRRASERMERVAAQITAARVAEARAEVEARHTAAVETGDLRAAQQAVQDLGNLARAEAEAEPDDAVADFMERNASWYDKDDDATAFAISISQRLAAQNKSKEEQCAAAEAAVKQRFPELFPAAPSARKQPAQVSNSNTRQSAPVNRGKGVADLPPSAQRHGADFVRLGLIPDMAAYAKAWHEENGQ